MNDYANAILQNANSLAPTSSPIVTDPTILGHISGANASKFAQNLLAPESNATAGMAQNTADLQQNAIKGAIQQSQQRQSDIQDALDPSKYRQVQNSAGGYDFYDPKGNKITVQDYAKVTGTNPAAILKNSTDPGDVQFRNDYANLQDLINGIANKDSSVTDAYFSNQPALKSMTPAQLIDKFKKYYSGYFGGQATSNAGTLLPNGDNSSVGGSIGS